MKILINRVETEVNENDKVEVIIIEHPGSYTGSTHIRVFRNGKQVYTNESNGKPKHWK